MRLRCLDLARYGKFTDHVVDFGARPDQGPDLHVIYGPNEAGKSTLFNAWLDLLFGIHPQSNYNFLHAYPAMRIGATVEIDGTAHDFIRLKRQQNSLHDGRDQPVSGATLQAALGGLDRDSYRTMFSLDSASLKQGGENILASRGDLGELLFSASAGLGELSQDLAQIRAETEGFYKYRARSGELADLKSQLAALKTERETLDTQASDYARLGKEYEEASTRYESAVEERRVLRAELSGVSAVLAALPWSAELDQLEVELNGLGDLPEVVPGWRDEIAALLDEDARLEASGAEIAKEIDRLGGELDTLDLDQQILSIRDRIAALTPLRSRYDSAEEDLPDRRLQLGRIEGNIRHVLAALGEPEAKDPAALLLDARTQADLADLLDQRTALDTKQANARAELDGAAAKLEEASQALRSARRQAAGPAADDDAGIDFDQHPDALAALVRTLADIRRQDHGLRLSTAERGLAPARERLQAGLAALAPWRGSVDELQAMRAPPPSSLSAWKAESESLAHKAARLDDETDRLEQTLRRLKAEHDAMVQSADLHTDEAVRDLRRVRDQVWATHKSTLDRDTAERFESAMSVHDQAADHRLANQAEAAKLRQTTLQIAAVNADLDSVGASRAALETRSLAHRAGITGAIASLSDTLDTAMTPGALEDWLRKRATALDLAQAARDLEHQITTAQQDRQVATDLLLQALAPFGCRPDAKTAQTELDRLLLEAEQLVEQQTALAELRRSLVAARSEVKRREADLQRIEDSAEAWLLAWKSVCAQSWLGGRDRVPSPRHAREILTLLGQLAPEVKEQAGLSDRIEKMERDQAGYVQALTELAAGIGISSDAMPPAELARHLKGRLAAAENAEARWQALSAQRDQARARQREHLQAQAAHTGKRTQMLAALRADTLGEAALRVERGLRRNQLSEQAGKLTRQICSSLNCATIEETRIRLNQADPVALDTRKGELEADLDIHDSRVQQLYAAMARAGEARDAVGGDDAVARIEQQSRTLLMTIGEQAERYLRLSAGVIAMEQALTLYRERHRSTMMARASDAVRTISRGRYTSLASQPDKGRELLIALQRDGPSIQVSEMSQGTEFQLYLALRIAGYHEFARARSTVPFIADDIMESFDDFRAEETFRLFAEMSGVGQVIYLTHHRHLCDIARAVCPEVRIHELVA